MPKVGVSLSITVCTDPNLRNFARFGASIEEIDVDGDIDAQVESSVAALLRVHTATNEGLEQAVTESITADYLPSLNIGHEITQLHEAVAHIKDALIPNIVNKVKELNAEVKGMESDEERVEEDADGD